MQNSFIKILTLNDPRFKKLDQLNDRPGQLHYFGADPVALTRAPNVAVVGTRKPTAYGMRLVQDVVRQLVAAGATIISGLAYGIDVSAHQTALKNRGTTIAVVPSDLEHVYPARHRQVAKSIVAAGGSIVSEYRVNPRPHPYQFLNRNRIIAALSDAVFIPEAAIRSGSLNTAHHARTLGIPVFAAPGRTIDPLSAGTNQLLVCKHALPALNAHDILAAIGIEPVPTEHTSRQQASQHSAEEQAVLSAVNTGQQTTDQIHHSTKITIAELQTLLTTLELNNHVVQNSQGQWSLAHD